jgi:hypothetical protein
VIQLLGENGIKYATFKSIKPYPEVTVDIDFLILNSYEQALERLQGAGYRLIERGPLSSTLRDPEIKIDYDIYDEVGVSNIIYLDKDKAADYIVEKQFQTGGYIDSLSPSIDLLAVIAHSVIKEQMYTLSEYYTTLFYLKNMEGVEIKKFLDMTDRLKLRNAVKAHIGLTYYLHKLVHGVEPTPLRRIASSVVLNNFEVERCIRNGLNMPHKFHPITLFRAFGDKLQESKSRRSFAKQIRSMMSPSFTMSFIPKFLSHVTRETY